MCGISAILSKFRDQKLFDLVQKMNQLICHRGPDGEGYAFVVANPKSEINFCFGNETPQAMIEGDFEFSPKNSISSIYKKYPDGVNVALGHRRLAIIDLSAGGHQPSSINGGEWLVTYNGEIYNYIEIRERLRLDGVAVRTASDTEVLLLSLMKYGVKAFDLWNGMFAFVAFQKDSGRCIAVRDRFAVKPLYFYFPQPGQIAFASEIKQFSVFGTWCAKLNKQRGYDFVISGLTDHTRETMFKDVFQLRGGEYLDFQIEDLPNFPTSKIWYTIKQSAFELSYQDAQQSFKELFEDSVRIRLRSDVPVGTALSGGIDSSSIVCVMNRILRDSLRPFSQKTFTSCSDISEFDEREFVLAVLAENKVDPHYTYMDDAQFLKDHEKAIWHHDEPLAGSSALAEWGVFRLVSSTDVRVTLDGHGADELLAGYPKFLGPKLFGFLSSGRLVRFLTEIMGEKRNRDRSLINSFSTLSEILPVPDFLLQALRRVLRQTYIDAKLIEHSSHYHDPTRQWQDSSPSLFSYSQALLMNTSLPHQLHWCDRDSMAFGIESRAPFLDYRLVEFIMNCPDEFKLHQGISKRILRTAMKDVIPEKISSRRDKMGFVTPEKVWITEKSPEFFLKEMSLALQDWEGFLTSKVSMRARSIIKKQERFNPLIWRIYSLRIWKEVFGVRLS